MNTIQAYKNDIELQKDALKNFKPQKPISKNLQNKTVFCGSGDSLAAAMLAEAFSEFRVKALDPLDLLKNKAINQKKIVYAVSISGKTITNVRVAKNAKESIAITSNPKSKLARVCSKVILLKFPNSDVFTAGSISFLESALTCISLVTKVKVPDPVSIFTKAKKIAKNSQYGNRVFVIGNLHTFPIAMYCAAKFFELLGIDAHFERIEQFSHMELFSAKKGDTVIIFEEKNKHNQHLVRNLKSVGIKAIHPVLGSKNKLSQILFYTFFSQLLPLNKVAKTKQKECNFVTAKKLRHISDNMIY